MASVLGDKKILLVSANLGLTFPLLQILNRMGIKPYVLGPPRRSFILKLGLFYERYIDLPLDGLGYDHSPTISSFSAAFIEQLNRVCEREQIDIVLPVDFTVTLPLSIHEEQLEPSIRLTPHLDEQRLRWLNDKRQFSVLLLEHAIPQPETRLLDGTRSLDALDLTFPVIIKPLNHGGGLGIHRLESREALKSHLKATSTDLSGHPLLCQTYLPGRDLQAFVFASAGRLQAWSMCIMERHGYRRFIHEPTVLKHCETLVAATDYDGPGLIDIRYDENTGQLGFLEINVRFPASTYYHYLAGVNYVELALLAALGAADHFAFTPTAEATVSRPLLDSLLAKVNQLTTPVHQYAKARDL